MTQDYRKRAEEFWNSYWSNLPPAKCELSTERLEREFNQVAQEARREENEACANVSEEAAYMSYGPHDHPERIAQKIRSRMEGK